MNSTVTKAAATLLLGATLATAAPAQIPHFAISDASAYVRQMLGEGSVLLKNEDNALPLEKGEGLALFGEAQVNAYDGTLSTLTLQRGYIPFGAGSSKAYADGTLIAPLDALRMEAEAGKLSLYEPLSRAYEQNLDYVPDAAMLQGAAAAAQTAVVFLRRWMGECRDMAAADWNLSQKETDLLRAVSASFDKVVVILNTGGPIDTSWARGEVEGIRVDSLLFVGYGGMLGGYAVSDILTGRVNPSGKLSTTFAKSLSDYPSHGHFGGTTVNYVEDIYLGYRHFDSFSSDRVAYGFGFGLSYTDFAMQVTSFSADAENVTLRVKVKNLGERAGKEVVQIYFSAPGTQNSDSARLDTAAHELCAFGKTELLNPGEEQTLELSFPISRMRQYDEKGVTGHPSAYVLEAGDYRIFAGNSLADAVTREAGCVKVESLTVVEQLSAQCAPVSLTRAAERTVAAKTATLSTGESDGELISIRIEGESFTEASSSHATQRPKIESFSGYLYNSATSTWDPYSGTCLGNMWPQDSYAIYRIEAPESGTYRLSLRLSSFASGGGYNVYYSDDNTNFSLLSINMNIPNTAETSGNLSKYYSFMDFSGYTVQLVEGTNYLKLERRTSAAPNVDSLTLSKVAGEDTEGGADEDVIRFAQVLRGEVSLEDYVAQMTDYELAEFFVAYAGKNGSEAGGSDYLCQKYGHRRSNMKDGPAGMSKNASSWPCETIVASAWNTELVTAMGMIIGREINQNGVDLLLAPGLNLHRYPLCGRNNEYYSEDPYLTGVMAAAMVRGVQSMGTGACVKHFVCNEQEANKLESNSIVSERALRQLYLYAFEIAIKTADPVAVMTSYNHVNGKPASASYDLLVNILRKEWGFDGMITGDWNNTKDPIDEINNGNGVRQPAAFCNIDVIYAAIDSGEIARETLVAGAENLLRALIRMENNYSANERCEDEHSYEDGVCTVCHRPDPDRYLRMDVYLDAVLSGRDVWTRDPNSFRRQPKTSGSGGGDTETDADSGDDPDPDTEPETEIETDPETEFETELETEPETELETELETEPETEPETESDTEPKPRKPVWPLVLAGATALLATASIAVTAVVLINRFKRRRK